MGPEIDERSANKNRLSEERFEYSRGRFSAKKAYITLHKVNDKNEKFT